MVAVLVAVAELAVAVVAVLCGGTRGVSGENGKWVFVPTIHHRG